MDNTDTIINRALDALEQRKGHTAQEEGYAVPEREIDPHRLPSVRHTKILDASIAGKPIDNPNWNLLVRWMLVQAMERLRDFDRLNELNSENMIQGQKDDEGYSYIPESDISVQGLSADKACSALRTVAQSLNIELEIGFMWRRKVGATCPGEKARLRMPGSRTESASNINRIPSPV